MQHLEFALDGISVTGTVVDLETVRIEPVPGGVYTFGYMSGKEIHIIQAENEPECGDLEQQIKTVWDTLPRPLYAYNKSFEEKWISVILGASVRIEHDLMQMWRATAEQQYLKWPRLRELIRPPIFYYRWGVADLDREVDSGKIRQAIRRAKSVNEVMSLEAKGDGPHIWWPKHLEAMQDPAIIQELSRLSGGDNTSRLPSVRRLPNGRWTTTELAAIICHNLIDLQSEAALLLWNWNTMSEWL